MRLLQNGHMDIVEQNVNSIVEKLQDRWISRPVVQGRLYIAIEQYAPPEAIAASLGDALEATRGVYADGACVAREPDYPTRLEAAKLVLKVQGIPAEDAQVPVNISLNLDPDRLAALARQLDELNARLLPPIPPTLTLTAADGATFGVA